MLSLGDGLTSSRLTSLTLQQTLAQAEVQQLLDSQPRLQELAVLAVEPESAPPLQVHTFVVHSTKLVYTGLGPCLCSCQFSNLINQYWPCPCIRWILFDAHKDHGPWARLRLYSKTLYLLCVAPTRCTPAHSNVVAQHVLCSAARFGCHASCWPRCIFSRNPCRCSSGRAV
jgi:hypothetical protein